MAENPRRHFGGRFVFGVFLIGSGLVLLAANLGWEIPLHVWSLWLWRNWPYVVLVLGIVRLLAPGTSRERRSGYWLAVLGAWGLVNTYQLFGLHWSTSWPLLLIAAGAPLVYQAMRPRSEIDH